LNMQSIPSAWRGTYGKSGHVEIVTGHKIGPNALLGHSGRADDDVG
jgi:hypothetical protein